MVDPHVVALQYRMDTGEILRFDNPPPVEDETEEFHMRLADGIATFQMKNHYPSEESARAPVDEYLQAWTITAALEHGRSAFQFTFDSAEIIDRSPVELRPGDAVAHTGSAQIVSTSALRVSALVTHKEYPQPPSNFRASWEVDALWYRYEQYKQGREPLTSVSYFCLRPCLTKNCLHMKDGGAMAASRGS